MPDDQVNRKQRNKESEAQLGKGGGLAPIEEDHAMATALAMSEGTHPTQQQHQQQQPPQHHSSEIPILKANGDRLRRAVDAKFTFLADHDHYHYQPIAQFFPY